MDREAAAAARDLTHMHNDLDYATLKASLPAHVEPAFDGMQITL